MKYRKKPVTIDAFQWDGTIECLRKNVNKKDWGKFYFGYDAFSGGYTDTTFYYLDNKLPEIKPDSYYINTLEGSHKLSKGDYVIKGVHGEYYPCKLDIFEETYEKVE